MAWLRGQTSRGGRLRLILHPTHECAEVLTGAPPVRAILRGRPQAVPEGPRDPQRAGLLVWAAAIDEAARRRVASGWQIEPGLLIAVLPHDSPQLVAAFEQRALALVAPQGERHAAYRIGRLTRWPHLWAAVDPLRSHWGRAARARAGDLCGVSLINLDWAHGYLQAAAQRLGARLLVDDSQFASSDQVPVAPAGSAGAVAAVFCPVRQWLDAMGTAGATKEMLDMGLRASLGASSPPGANGGVSPPDRNAGSGSRGL